MAVKSRAELNIANSSDTGVRVGLGVRVGPGVGVMIGALVGIGMLDAATGPATGVLVGGTGVEVSAGALVGVGVGTGSCPQARVRVSASVRHRTESIDFILWYLTKDYFPLTYVSS